jgi:hypothetical protein
MRTSSGRLRCATQRDRRQVLERLASPALVEPPFAGGPPQHRGNLEIDELGRH